MVYKYCQILLKFRHIGKNITNITALKLEINNIVHRG